MQQYPFFSIIIPTYNRHDFLLTAIESVLGQTFKDWELIVVDDGSTDDTQHLVSRYVTADSRVSCIYQDHQERSVARNNGIGAAKGSYICFLDSDDYYLPNHLEVLCRHIRTHSGGERLWATGAWDEVDDGRWMQNRLFRKDRDIPFRFLWQTGIYVFQFAFPRTVLEQHPFPPHFHLSEDRVFLMQLLLGYPFTQIPIFTVVTRQHPGQSSVDKFRYHPLENHALEQQAITVLADLVSRSGQATLTEREVRAKRYRVAHIYAAQVARLENRTALRTLLQEMKKHKFSNLRWLRDVLKIGIVSFLVRTRLKSFN